jgi:hypothetical protein
MGALAAGVHVSAPSSAGLRKRSRILNRGGAVAIYAIDISQSKRTDFDSLMLVAALFGDKQCVQ